MKYIRSLLYLTFLCGIFISSHAAPPITPTEFNKQFASATADTARMRLLTYIGAYYFYTNIDSAIFYWQKGVEIGSRNQYHADEEIRKTARSRMSSSLSNLGIAFKIKGRYNQSMQAYKQAFQIAYLEKDYYLMGRILNNMGTIKSDQGHFEEARRYFDEAYQLAVSQDDTSSMYSPLTNLGIVFEEMGKRDEAIRMYRKALNLAAGLERWYIVADIYANIGSNYAALTDADSAMHYFEKGLTLARELDYQTGFAYFYIEIAQVYELEKDFGQAVKWGEDARAVAEGLDQMDELKRIYFILSRIYGKRGDYERAYHYLSEDKRVNAETFSSKEAIEFGQMEMLYLNEKSKYEDYIAAADAAAAFRATNYRHYLIAFGCLCIFAILMLATIRFSRKTTLKKFIVFTSLIFFFEFILILLDNSVDEYTGGLPFPKLLLNIGLALLITPAHGYLERYVLKGKKKDEISESEEVPVSEHG